MTARSAEQMVRGFGPLTRAGVLVLAIILTGCGGEAHECAQLDWDAYWAAEAAAKAQAHFPGVDAAVMRSRADEALAAFDRCWQTHPEFYSGDSFHYKDRVWIGRQLIKAGALPSAQGVGQPLGGG